MEQTITEMPAETPEPRANAPETQEELATLRRRRLRELLVESLGSPDALAASSGVARADLLSIATRVMELIERGNAGRPDSGDEFERLLRSAQLYLRITRQAERLTQLDALFGNRASHV
jgi:hypothetical protein